MSKTDMNTPPSTWQLVLGRQGLCVNAGRHLRVSVSLPLLSWLVSLSGIAGAGSYWNFFG
ncbi:hypothetical protein WDH52_24260 [Streptomyces sp. TRM70308]|uniref:hypothetical protein n=1 Tax=Streptomyces sp. TRM70308 TaxID=3131932 RepID=UPI003CFF9D92